MLKTKIWDLKFFFSDSFIGVILSWDGDSFVELSVPPDYRNKMCGLCGNYNGDRHDDMRTLKGEFTNDVRTFGESWRVGGNKLCDTSGVKKKKYPCWDNGKARRRAQESCRVLKSKPFQKCHNVVDLWVYYRWVVMNMHECVLCIYNYRRVVMNMHECVLCNK